MNDPLVSAVSHCWREPGNTCTCHPIKQIRKQCTGPRPTSAPNILRSYMRQKPSQPICNNPAAVTLGAAHTTQNEHSWPLIEAKRRLLRTGPRDAAQATAQKLNRNLFSVSHF
jgi:hypothetical protein